jgi:histone H3/H4
MSTTAAKIVKKPVKKLVKKPATVAEPVVQVAQVLSTEEQVLKKVKRTKKPDAAASPVKKVTKKKVEKLAAPTEGLQVEVTPQVALEAEVAPEAEVPLEPAAEATEKAQKRKRKIIPPKQGLNFAVTKIRRILSNKCLDPDSHAINQLLDAVRVYPEVVKVVAEGGEAKELTPEEIAENKAKSRVFSLELSSIPEVVLQYLESCVKKIESKIRLDHVAAALKASTNEKRKEYETTKKKAMKEFVQKYRKENPFDAPSFDLVSFNETHFPDLLHGVEGSLTEMNAWKNLRDAELYDACVNIIRKNNVRFNTEAQVFITAFIEYIVKQVITNAIHNCVSSGKKTIKVEHAVDLSSEDIQTRMPLRAIISSLNTFKSAEERLRLALSEKKAKRRRASKKGSEEAQAEPQELPEASASLDEQESDHLDEDDDKSKELLLEHSIKSLCNSSKVEIALAKATGADALLEDSEYIQTKISKLFKKFCSDLSVELLELFGRILKTEVVSRKVKTIKHNIAYALFNLVHTIYDSSDVTESTFTAVFELFNRDLEFRAKSRSDKQEKKNAAK